MNLSEATKLMKKLETQSEKIFKNKFPKCPSALSEALIAQYGIEISSETDYEYENRVILNVSPEINLHNLHHYMVACPSRKLVLDFGLGNPIGKYPPKVKVSETVAQKEEELVSCLDALRAIEHGYSLREVNYNYDNPNDLVNLFQMGLITKDGKIKPKANFTKAKGPHEKKVSK